MLSTERPQFDEAMTRLCASYNSPPTQQRRNAYFESLRKLTLDEWNGLVHECTTTSKYADLPTTGQLWQLYEALNAPAAPAPDTGEFTPSVQERLTAFAARKFGQSIVGVRDGTFVYRLLNDGNRGAECIGWMGWKPDGYRLTVSVAEMNAGWR